MYHFTTCIEELSFTSECYTCKFSMCTFTVENTHWIQTRNFGAKGTRYPLNCTIFTYYTTFCVKVVHVFRPVFNCRITQCSIIFNEQFNSACMKVRHIILRSRTTFDKVQFSPFFYDNHRMFELTSTWCIQTEVRLQWNLYLYTGRNVYEGTTRPNGTMKGSPFMVCRWN